MRISFHGAVREVTGSCHLVEVGGVRLLLDCGLFQGSWFAEERNHAPFPFDPDTIDGVVLTHAHLDHCGRLPKLVHDGFRGPIYCTPPTADFATVMLTDSARVIVDESHRSGWPPVYTEADVQRLATQLRPVDYHQPIAVAPGVEVTFYDAGHILGSAFVVVTATENGQQKQLAFSGDLGNPPAPIVRDPETLPGADAVIVESTYGGRVHEPGSERLALLKAAVAHSIGQGGTLLMPAFALERAQEIIYELNTLVETGQIPAVPVFVDSPLAIAATDVYRRHQQYYDTDAMALIKKGDDFFAFPGLRFTKTVPESKKINTVRGPKVIIAGSGMCNGGRIVHHLRHYLEQPSTHVLIVSYQPNGSLGRQLLGGAREVTVLGDRVRVRASVSAIGAYSAHADEPKLLNWIAAMQSPRPQQVFVVHGEDEAAASLAAGVARQGDQSLVPEYGTVYEV